MISVNKQTIEKARLFFKARNTQQKDRVQEDILPALDWFHPILLTNSKRVLSSNPKDSKGLRLRHIALGAMASESKFRHCISRLEQIEWIREIISKDKSLGEKEDWRKFVEMGIRDFHIDVITAFDSLAFLVGHVEEIKMKQNHWPSFSQFYSTKMTQWYACASKYPAIFNNNLENFFEILKEVRHRLVHTEPQIIIFGDLNDGIFFQIEEPREFYLHEKVDKLLIWQNNVIDFNLYSANIISEFTILMKEFGDWVENKERLLKPKKDQRYYLSPNIMVNFDRLFEAI